MNHTEYDEEENENNKDQVKSILTLEVTVVKPTKKHWKIISNSSILCFYSKTVNQQQQPSLDLANIVPTELVLWKESHKQDKPQGSFDLFLFLRLNENVQFQICKASIANDVEALHDSPLLTSQSYLVIKYVDTRTEKIQFFGLIFANVIDLQHTWDLLQRCQSGMTSPGRTVPSTQQRRNLFMDDDNEKGDDSPRTDTSVKQERRRKQKKVISDRLQRFKNMLLEQAQQQLANHEQQIDYHNRQRSLLLQQIQQLNHE